MMWALLAGVLAVLFLATIVALVLRWLDRADHAYPAEISEDEYR